MKKIIVTFFAAVIAFSFSGVVLADDDVNPPAANVTDQMIASGEEPAPDAVAVPESVPEPAPAPEPAPSAEPAPTPEPAPEPAPEPTPEPAPEPAPEPTPEPAPL